MIVQPNHEELPKFAGNDPGGTGRENLGHKKDFEGSFTKPTPMNAANVHRGCGNAGFGFGTDPTGENNYPRPTGDHPSIPGA